MVNDKSISTKMNQKRIKKFKEKARRNNQTPSTRIRELIEADLERKHSKIDPTALRKIKKIQKLVNSTLEG